MKFKKIDKRPHNFGVTLFVISVRDTVVLES